MPEGDPLGKPDHFAVFVTPQVNVTYRHSLPMAVSGQHNLEGLSVLNQSTLLDRTKAPTLIKAARLYQDALWLAESQPELSWLLLVSALEAAANEWQKARGAAVQRLELSKPELYRYLANLPDRSVLQEVTSHIADSLGIAKKFIDFMMKFLPEPPAARPPENFQFNWNDEELRTAFRMIYGYRSKALHEGRPFPPPMSEAPYTDPRWGGCAEIMSGLGSGQLGGTWLKKDIPMNLHLFEHITRNVLLNWWKFCTSSSED